MNASVDFHRQLVRRRQAELESDACWERVAHPHDLEDEARPATGIRVRVGRSLISIGESLAGDGHARRAV